MKAKKVIIVQETKEKQEVHDFFRSQRHIKSKLEKPSIPIIPSFSLNKDDVDYIKRIIFDEFNEDFKKKKKELKELGNKISLELLDNNSPFVKTLKSYLLRAIGGEVSSQLKQEKIHLAVNNLIKDYIKKHLKPIISEIASLLVNDANRRLQGEYKITKELIYSIDATIKHTLMELPISSESDNIIKEKIKDYFSKLKPEQILIEVEK